MQGDEILQTYPWLSWNCFYKITHDPGSKNLIEATRDKVIWTYCDGWLVLRDKTTLNLTNIESLKEIKLPSLNPNFEPTCILTSSPRNPNCRVLFMAEDKILHCRPGDEKYKTLLLQKSMHVARSLTVMEGKVYYIIKKRSLTEHDLGVIDFNGSNLRVSKLECSPLPSEFLKFDRYLTVSDGKLLMVLKGYLKLYPRVLPQQKPQSISDLIYHLRINHTEVFCISVFQFDFVNNEWGKIDDIGNSTIFLPLTKPSTWYGVAFRATKPRIKPNSIYFLQEDGFIHVYCLENSSFSLLPNGLKKVTLHIQEKSNGNLDCQEQSTKFLPQLPLDISDVILARVFTDDPGALAVIRSVCKDWNSISPPLTYNIDITKKKYPYLMTLNNGTCKFFHPTYNHTFSLDAPELLGARTRIKFSRFGWLLLSSYNSATRIYEYFFFNPFKNKRENLPSGIVGGAEFATMSFSSPPTSSTCFVVGIQAFGLSLAILKYGEEDWSFLQNYALNIPNMAFPFSSRIVSYHPVFYEQKCYCLLGTNKTLLVIDLNTRNVSTIGEKVPKELVKFRGCFLVEDKEGLLGIFLETNKRTPHVMKMDLSQDKKMWKAVENLNEKMVFISPTTSWSDSAPTKSTGNKIYFPMVWNSNCVFYSLSTRKYHSFSGSYASRGCPFEAQMVKNCTWIYVD